MIHKLKPLFFTLLMLFPGFYQASAQTQDNNIVGGTVTDTDGRALPGVDVSVPGAFTYTVTDNEGTFSISVEPGRYLTFAKQGYASVNIDIEYGMQNIEVTMEMKYGEELVSVAYGTRRKSELTHAVSSIRAADLEKTPVPNMTNAVVGRTTGITALKNTGDEPGYDNSSIYVRGIGTFSNFQGPLVLIDNVERNFAQIDPLEIESFAVLKDAAATVQYGMRGANGVISIRTKRGFVGKPEIKIVSQAGIQTPSRLPEYLGAAEYVAFYRQALLNDGLQIPSGSTYDPAMYDGTQDPYTYPDIDWYGKFLKDVAPQQQHKLSFRGGTDAIRYFLFMGVTQQDGIYEFAEENPRYSTNPRFTRYNLRSNIDVDVTESLLVSVDLSTRVENRHVPNTSAAAIFSTLSQLPPNAMPLENRDGSLAGTSIYRNNPLGMISRTGYRDNYDRILFGNVEVAQELDFLLEGLSVSGMIGLDGANYYALGRSQQYAVYEEFLEDDSYVYQQYGENTDISLDIQKFDDAFSYMFTSIGGFNYFNRFGSNSLGADLKYMQSKFFPHGNDIAYANQGVFGRATYGIRDTYFMEFGFAYNGSENFKPGNRFGFFPAISGAWILSNETFMPENTSISFLKVRGSFGMTGNGQLGVERFPYEQKFFSGGGYIFGSGFSWAPGSYEGRIASPHIQWEESINSNLGADLELDNNLMVSLDIFHNYRSKIITTGANTIPSILGQNTPYENNGTVVNRGFETMFRYHGEAREWSYSLQGNISYAQNEIRNMDEVDGLLDYQYMQGNPVTSIWGLEAIGLFRDQEQIDNNPHQVFDIIQPGDIQFKDQNGDNIIDAQDQVVIGNTMPSWNFGLLGSVRYKNFDLHFVLNGIMGRTVMLTNNSVWMLQDNNKVTALAYDSWQEGVNEANASYPRLTTQNNQNNYNSSSFWARKGDFLRLTNIEAGYNLSPTVLSRAGIREVRFFINAHNLFTIDHLSDYNLDPEVPNAGVNGYPVMRVVNTGVSVNF